MITTRSDLDRAENQESSLGHAADQRVWSYLTIQLARDASVGTPWLLEEDTGQEVPSLSIYLSI